MVQGALGFRVHFRLPFSEVGFQNRPSQQPHFTLILTTCCTTHRENTAMCCLMSKRYLDFEPEKLPVACYGPPSEASFSATQTVAL